MEISENLRSTLEQFRPRIQAARCAPDLEAVVHDLRTALREVLDPELFGQIEPLLAPRHSAVVLAVTRDNYFLFLRRSEEAPIAPGEWCLPGGTLNKGETALAAALREFFEEVGILLTEEGIIFYGDAGRLEVNHRAFGIFLVSIHTALLDCTREELEERIHFSRNSTGHFEHDAFCVHDLKSGGGGWVREHNASTGSFGPSQPVVSGELQRFAVGENIAKRLAEG